MSDLRKETEMTNHQYGPKGHIVDTFLEHLKQMTEADWLAVSAEWCVTDYAARDVAWHVAVAAAGSAAAAAAGSAARYASAAGSVALSASAAGSAAWYTAWHAAWYAACEIQGADLLRERRRPFFFLPMFGFADERAIIKQERR